MHCNGSSLPQLQTTVIHSHSFQKNLFTRKWKFVDKPISSFCPSMSEYHIPPQQGRLYLHGRKGRVIRPGSEIFTAPEPPKPTTIFSLKLDEYNKMKGNYHFLLEKLKSEREDVRGMLAAVVGRTKVYKYKTVSKEVLDEIRRCKTLSSNFIVVIEKLNEHISFIRGKYHDSIIQIKRFHTLNKMLKAREKKGEIRREEIGLDSTSTIGTEVRAAKLESGTSLTQDQMYSKSLENLMVHIKFLNGEFKDNLDSTKKTELERLVQTQNPAILVQNLMEQEFVHPSNELKKKRVSPSPPKTKSPFRPTRARPQIPYARSY